MGQPIPDDIRESPYGCLPAHWHVRPLSECAEVQTGVAKGRNLAGEDSVTVPYLRVANVQDGFLDLSEIKEIVIRRREVERFSLRPGDVLLTEGGDFDKLGRGFVWQGQIPHCVHQNHVFAVRPNSNLLDPEFLAYLTQSTYGKAYFLSVAHKTTNLACINTAKLKALPAPLPPLAEQRAITHVLRTVQRAKEAAEAVVTAARQLKQSLLRHLFTYGPVPVADAEDVALADSEVGEIPAHWQVSSLGETSTLFQYGTSSRCHEEPRGHPVLRIPNVIRDRIDPADLKYLALGSEADKYLLRRGDLLFVRTNGQRSYVGRCAVYAGEPDAALFASYLIRVRLDQKRLLPAFLQMYSATGPGRQFLSGRASGAADGKFNINTQTLREVLLPLPPLREQETIVEMVETADQKANAEQCKVDALDTLFKTLLRDLMTGRVRVHDLDLAP